MRLGQERDWLVGYQDETWWSREAQPRLRTWATLGRPQRLVEHHVPATDPSPKALACYGLWLPTVAETWLRFVDGRPISALTTQYLDWCLVQAAARGQTTLLLVWDQASWHLSKEVTRWIRGHNQTVQRTGQGVRLIPCRLPSKSPWLNLIEPKWRQGKRQVVEPERLLSLDEVEARVCAAFRCPRYQHLVIPNNVS